MTELIQTKFFIYSKKPTNLEKQLLLIKKSFIT